MTSKKRQFIDIDVHKSVNANDWRHVRLSELCIQDRHIVVPGSQNALDLPYISLEHIESDSGRIIKELSVDTDGVRSTTFAFDERHVLYGKLRPYLNKVALPDFKGRCTTELIPLLPRPNVSRRYMALLLRRPVVVAAAMEEKTGARMPRASMKHVLAVRVMIPASIEYQEQLAATFENSMNSIAQARVALNNQLENLEALSKKMLTEFPEIFIRNGGRNSS